jgi:Ca2+-binding EF-hand superfamily protein
VDLAKTNFDFYSKSKGTQIDLFELPMLLSACGSQVSPQQLEILQTFLHDKGASKIDFPALNSVLTHLKVLQATTESAVEGDEYLDAFVFLGGMPNKEGCIEKNLLIEVIKEEFGLTIDMVVSSN